MKNENTKKDTSARIYNFRIRDIWARVYATNDSSCVTLTPPY